MCINELITKALLDNGGVIVLNEDNTIADEGKHQLFSDMLDLTQDTSVEVCDINQALDVYRIDDFHVNARRLELREQLLCMVSKDYENIVRKIKDVDSAIRWVESGWDIIDYYLLEQNNIDPDVALDVVKILHLSGVIK